MRHPCLVVILVLLTSTAQAAWPGVVKKEFVFEKAPFASCHASTIVETTKGNLVVAFFAGTEEKNPDVGIWLSRLVDGKWTAPVEVANGVQADGSRQPCWNPALFQPARGPLMLFYKVGPSPSKWWGMLRTSDDEGKTWSDARRLPDGILGPIKNKPVQLAGGDIICPSSTEHNGWQVHFERTSDLGKTWTSTKPVNDGKQLGAIQPSILFRGEIGGDKLLAVGRTQQRAIFRITSDDGGKTWGEMTLMPQANPNSGIDAVTLRDGRQLLVYNDSVTERTPLNVAVARHGESWESAGLLENEPGAEFSYPAVIQTHDGMVHCTWTWKRKRVKHIVIDPTKIELDEVPRSRR